MTLKEKIGQLVMIGFDGTEPPVEVCRLIQAYQVGGVILFSRNIKTPSQCADLTASLQRLSRGLPLFLAVDQEGGRVARLPLPHTQFPTARVLGECDVTALTYRCGEAMARELRAVGFNMDFAPVLDVWTNPKNKVIGDRAFGSDPDCVARHGLAMIAGLQNQKVIACGKHFPGHGDTTEDSHETLPRVGHDLDRLLQVEVKPFMGEVSRQVATIMMAHVLYPALDRERPASLSEAVTTSLLRKTVGYDGVVISDDLEMKGITKDYAIADAAVMALTAGSDLILICHSLEQQVASIEALIHAVEKGIVSEARLHESLRRIRKLKERFLSPGEVFASERIEEVVGCPAHWALIEEIQREHCQRGDR